MNQRSSERFSFLLVLVALGSVAPFARAQDKALIEAGRIIYEEGVLPNGQPLVGSRPEGFRLEGEPAACTSCHRASGMGSIEGTGDSAILVPPLVGPVLFAPARWHDRPPDHELDDTHHFVPNPTWQRAYTRPAYDDEALAVSLREGRNPAGEPLEIPMPLYDLDSRAQAALTAYLRSLGATADPGTDGEFVEVALVITPDADPIDAAAVSRVLEAWTKAGARYGVKTTQYRKPVRVTEWRLKGPPGQWWAQLEAAYAKSPVFALLSGVGRSNWRPVSEFCERFEVPCILPSVDVVASDPGHFSMYFSRGVVLEARILADHFEKTPPRGSIVQLFTDPSGKAAAAELSRKLVDSDVVVETRRLRALAPSVTLRDVGPDDVIVAWLRPEVLAFLAHGVTDLPSASIYLSGTLATPGRYTLPPTWHDETRIVTFDDEVSMQRQVARLRLERWLDEKRVGRQGDPRILADAYVAGYLFHAGLALIVKEEIRHPRVPLTREHLIEQLEDLVSRRSDGTKVIDEDLHVGHYGRMSMGPTQRIATRGGTIMKFKSPGSTRLLAVTPRITPY